MGYQPALSKAWERIEKVLQGNDHDVVFLHDTYDIRVKERSILSRSCNIPPKDSLAILILHYAARSLEDKYVPCGELVSFKDIEGGEIYYPAFRESAITPILRKYGACPESILEAGARLGGIRVADGDVGIEIPIFKDVSARIVLWRADEEFGAEATILFDRTLTAIFQTEDVAVLFRHVANAL